MGDHLNFKIERDELAERLGGGLPTGSVIAVEGPFGAGKSILTQRVLYGLLEQGATVGIVSTELTTLGFVRQMKSLDYPIEKHIISGRLLFYPVYPLMGDRHVPPDLLNRLRHAGRLYDRDVIIVDTFSKLLFDQMRAFEEHGVRRNRGQPASSPQAALRAEAELTLYHLKRLSAQGKTIILTLEPESMPPAPGLMSLFRDSSDVHMNVDFQLIGATASRRIIVKRFMRAKNRFGDVIGFRVEPGIGLVIEIKSVA